MMFNNYHGMWNFWIFGLLILIIIALYVANDAVQFGQNGFLWALVVLLMPMMGIVIYIVIRSTWVSSYKEVTNERTQFGYQRQTSPPRREIIRQKYNEHPIQDRSIKEEKIGKQFCTSCGSENNESAVYCNSCGSLI